MKRLILTVAPALGLLIAPPASAEPASTDSNSCNDRATTVDISTCVQAETRQWDQRLNAAYKNLAQRIDAGQREPLTAAQRLWMQYRDANCLFYGSQEGSIRQIQGAECMRAMTEERALELERAMKFD